MGQSIDGKEASFGKKNEKRKITLKNIRNSFQQGSFITNKIIEDEESQQRVDSLDSSISNDRQESPEKNLSLAENILNQPTPDAQRYQEIIITPNIDRDFSYDREIVEEESSI